MDNQIVAGLTNTCWYKAVQILSSVTVSVWYEVHGVQDNYEHIYLSICTIQMKYEQKIFMN